MCIIFDRFPFPEKGMFLQTSLFQRHYEYGVSKPQPPHLASKKVIETNISKKPVFNTIYSYCLWNRVIFFGDLWQAEFFCKWVRKFRNDFGVFFVFCFASGKRVEKFCSEVLSPTWIKDCRKYIFKCLFIVCNYESLSICFVFFQYLLYWFKESIFYHFL